MRTVRFNAIGVGALAATTALAVGYYSLSSCPTLAQAKDQDKKCVVCSDVHAETFTGTFRKAMPTEVVEWMNKEGIHFDVDLLELPQAPLSFAFDGLDEKGVVVAFGKTVGMQPVKRDGVYSLMRDVGGDSTSEPLGSEDSQDNSKFRILIGPDGSISRSGRPATMQDRDDDEEFVFELDFDEEFDFDFDWDEDFDFDFEGLQDFNFQIPDVGKIIEEVMAALKDAGIGEGSQKLTDEQKAKLEASLKERLGGLHERLGNMRIGLTDRFNSDEFKKMMELRGFEEGRLKGLMELRGLQDVKLKELFEMDLDKMRHEDGRELTDKEKQKVKRALADARKAMEEAMKNFKEGDFKGFDGKALEKMMQERFSNSGEGLRLRGFDSEAFAKMMKKRFGENGELQKRLKEMDGKLKIQMKDLESKLANLKKFMDSLTDEQNALAEKQGHLNWSDLTKKQQELLGEFGKEGGTIQFNLDGNGVTINKDKKKGGISA